MESKKILIVSRFFFPLNTPRAFRTTELAKEFARKGHEVTVLIPDVTEERLQFAQKYGFTINSLGKLKWKVPNFGNSKLNYLMTRAAVRFLQLGFEYPAIELMFLVKKALKKANAYDLLISIAVPYPIHWGVAKARSKKNPIAKTWVADCGDPYVGRENDTFRVPFYFNYVEKWFMRKADFISVPTQGAVGAYFSEFHHKMRVIPQGFRFEDVKVYKEGRDKQKVLFGYGGMFIPGKRDPSEFLEYLTTLHNDFEFHVFTKTPHLVKPFAAKSNGRIIIHDPIPRLELLFELSKMDFLVNFENAGIKQTPSKLIDYAILSKPVLSIRTAALSKKSVDEFIGGNYSNQLIIDNPDQYRIENVCKAFTSINPGSL